MQSYGQYCPVAKASEILGDRWTLLIVRELIGGQQHFNGIARGLPGIPRSVLSGRLRRLQAAGVIDRVPENARGVRYELTAAGLELREVVDALGKWGTAWAFEAPFQEDLDPGLLLWRMQNRLNAKALPRQRVTIEFNFRKGRKKRFWFVIDKGAASVCLSDPGFEIGLVVSADLSAFHQVWLGRMSLRHAVAAGLVWIEGIPALERGFSKWFLWSPMAKFASAASKAEGRA